MDGLPGIREVAQAAGVSPTTVSHALAGKGKMSAETRARVVAIAADLGYAPNRLAQSLRSRRSNVIGLVNDTIATTPFAGRVLLGVQVAAEKHGFVVMMVSTNESPETERKDFRILESFQVDGLIYAKMFHQVIDLPPALVRLPSVVVDAAPRTFERPAVVPDELGIGEAATEYLVEHGHRDIAHLTIEVDQPSKLGRAEGFRRVLASAAGRGSVFIDESTSSGGYRAAWEALARDPRPTALFCFNDQMAMGAYYAAAAFGLSVPEDLSVFGVDNFEVVAAELRPGLTTIALPHFDMGVWAVESLVGQLESPGEGPSREYAVTQLPGSLIERGSVAAPPQGLGA